MTSLLGKVVRDKITGLTGIASSYVDYLTGMRQYSVQPKGTGDNMPDSWCIDVDNLDPVEGEGVSVIPAPKTEINLGDKVEDIITNFVGIASRKHTYTNGCVFFYVEGSVKWNFLPFRKKEDPGNIHVSHERLKVLELGHYSKLKAEQARAAKKIHDDDNFKNVATPLVPVKRTGGPSTRAMRI